MSYQKLKQLRDDLITKFHDSNLQNITFLDSKAYDALLCFIDEYENLTRQMLQHIKQLESEDLFLGKTPVREDNAEDRKWLESYLSLGE